MSKKTLTAVLAAGSMVLGFSGAAQAKSPVPGKPGTQNIVEIALGVNAGLPVFDYLIGAATCEGQESVVSILTGKDKVTLFAPTDTAFRNLLKIPQPAEGEEEPSGEVFPCDAVPADNPDQHPRLPRHRWPPLLQQRVQQERAEDGRDADRPVHRHESRPDD